MFVCVSAKIGFAIGEFIVVLLKHDLCRKDVSEDGHVNVNILNDDMLYFFQQISKVWSTVFMVVYIQQ